MGSQQLEARFAEPEFMVHSPLQEKEDQTSRLGDSQYVGAGAAKAAAEMYAGVWSCTIPAVGIVAVYFS